MSPETQPPHSPGPEGIAAALAAVRQSKPEDYDGHTEFARLSPNDRLTWLEAAVRFVQASKEARKSAAP
jgi:hypothetical protein